MDSIQDFIQAAGQKVGVNEDSARTATGGLLQMIQKQVGDGEFSQLTSKIPGAADVLKAAPGESKGVGGLAGGLMDKVGGSLGGKLAGAASVMALFKKSGIDSGQAGNFVSMFFDFAKNKAGADLVGQILDKLPDVKKLLG